MSTDRHLLLRRAARWYLEQLGWATIPLAGKRPVPARWQDTPADLAPIDEQLRRHPGANNLGVVTGRNSGIAVIDVDPRNGADKSLAELVERVGPLPVTATAYTGGGGRHYFYSLSAGDHAPTGAHKLGVGVDIKAGGGQVVVAPSIHPDTGRAYRWEGARPGALAPWPAEQLAPVLAPEPAPLPPLPRPPHPKRAGDPDGRLLAGLVAVVADAGEGERNARLYWAACRVAEHGAVGRLHEADAVGALLAAAQGAGLPCTEAERTLRSGLRSGRARGAA